jgi:hypothetical protein
LIDITEGKKKEVRLKAYCVFTDKLEGSHIKLTTEIAQKSRDSMLLIGARVPGKLDEKGTIFFLLKSGGGNQGLLLSLSTTNPF